MMSSACKRETSDLWSRYLCIYSRYHGRAMSKWRCCLSLSLSLSHSFSFSFSCSGIVITFCLSVSLSLTLILSFFLSLSLSLSLSLIYFILSFCLSIGSSLNHCQVFLLQICITHIHTTHTRAHAQNPHPLICISLFYLSFILFSPFEVFSSTCVSLHVFDVSQIHSVAHPYFFSSSSSLFLSSLVSPSLSRSLLFFSPFLFGISPEPLLGW